MPTPNFRLKYNVDFADTGSLLLGHSVQGTPILSAAPVGFGTTLDTNGATGSLTYIDTNKDLVLDNSQPWTLEFRFFMRPAGGYLFAHFPNGFESYGWQAASDTGNFSIGRFTDGLGGISDPLPAVYNQWFHYALVNDTTNLSLYRDGVLVNSVPSSSIDLYSVPTAGAHTLIVGARLHLGGHERSDSQIDEVLFYKNYVKYTSNFAPPTNDSELPPPAPTNDSELPPPAPTVEYAQPHVISTKQGAPKLSEVACDRPISIIQTAERQDSMTVVNQLNKVIGDLFRKTSYILLSQGEIAWDAIFEMIKFNIGDSPTDIIFKIFQWEDSGRTVDIKMQGAVSNSDSTFLDISILPDELLYLEINRPAMLAESVSGTVIVKNGLFNPTVSGAVILRKVTMSSTTGMPQLISNITESNTSTMSVPLVMRKDYTYNTIDFKDLMWIPHGIRWPKGTQSTIGEVIVSGFETMSNFYCSTATQLESALASISSAGGGTVCITSPITLTDYITVGENVTLTSRGWNEGQINCPSGTGLTLGKRSKVHNIAFVGLPPFGSVSAESIVNIPLATKRCKIVDCKFTLQNTTGNSTCIKVNGSETRIDNCLFVGIDAQPSFRTGIEYAAGYGNTDIDSLFE